MKQKNKLKDLLIGTSGLLLLTLIQFLRDSATPSHYRGYRDGFELLLFWIIALVSWIIYLIGVIRNRRKDKEHDPWDIKEK